MRQFSNLVRLPGSTHVTDLWVNEVTYATQFSFPTLMCRSEDHLCRKASTVAFPKCNAILTGQGTRVEWFGEHVLESDKRQRQPCRAFGELSRNLTGTIDSPVNGGFTQYREFFGTNLQPPLQKRDAQSLKLAFSELAI